MTYLYISDTDGGGSNSMIPGMGSSGATLKTGTLAAAGDSCLVAFTFPAEKNDSVKMQFTFADREKDGKPVDVIYETGIFSEDLKTLHFDSFRSMRSKFGSYYIFKDIDFTR